MKKLLQRLGWTLGKSLEDDGQASEPTPRRKIGLVFSGGGTRAAYQIGALKALREDLEDPDNHLIAVVGSSIGAVNALLFASGLQRGVEASIAELESMWRARTYANTFQGSPSRAFLRALKIAILRYSSPGPTATDHSIFDPTPLINVINEVLIKNGRLTLESRHPDLELVGVMTTLEGEQRKPLVFASATRQLTPDTLTGASFDMHYVDELTAQHGLASAALPSVLPPVELDTAEGAVRLVDGGICDNIPVDPAVRYGAERVIILDASGRQWWLNHYGKSHDSPPQWEVPAGVQTYCVRPPDTFAARNIKPFGPLLRDACAGSTRDFMEALGPTWPIYTLLKRKMGAELAYEVMSYVALHPNYVGALIDRGYQETKEKLQRTSSQHLEFERVTSFEDWYEAI